MQDIKDCQNPCFDSTVHLWRYFPTGLYYYTRALLVTLLRDYRMENSSHPFRCCFTNCGMSWEKSKSGEVTLFAVSSGSRKLKTFESSKPVIDDSTAVVFLRYYGLARLIVGLLEWQRCQVWSTYPNHPVYAIKLDNVNNESARNNLEADRQCVR